MTPFRTTRKIVNIGRNNFCHVRSENLGVSRHHAILSVQGQTIIVHAMQTSNGTTLNNKTIPESTEVEAKSGDILTCGGRVAYALLLETNAGGVTELVVMDAHEYLQQQRQLTTGASISVAIRYVDDQSIATRGHHDQSVVGHGLDQSFAFPAHDRSMLPDREQSIVGHGHQDHPSPGLCDDKK